MLHVIRQSCCFCSCSCSSSMRKNSSNRTHEFLLSRPCPHSCDCSSYFPVARVGDVPASVFLCYCDCRSSHCYCRGETVQRIRSSSGAQVYLSQLPQGRGRHHRPFRVGTRWQAMQCYVVRNGIESTVPYSALSRWAAFVQYCFIQCYMSRSTSASYNKGRASSMSIWIETAEGNSRCQSMSPLHL